MLRTIVTRGNLIRETVRKTTRTNLTRAVAAECSKRRHYNTKATILKPNHQQSCQYNFVRHYATLPPHVKVNLPALSPTMESGSIVSWEKKEGDKLSEGDLLAEIETDKATMGFETPEEGYLAKIVIPAGTKDVPIGKLVCIIVQDEKDVAAFKDFKDEGGAPAPAAAAPAKAPSPPPAAAPAPPSPAAPAPAAAPVAGERVYASPMAKKLAEQQQIRLQGKGTGLFESITSSDLAKLAGAAPAPAKRAGSPPPARPTVPAGAAYVDIPISNVRGVIAKRLLGSTQGVPHYYETVEVQIDKMMALRGRVNKKLEKKGVKLSVNDFIIKASAMACKRVPGSNSAWMDTVIRQYKNVDISVAVTSDKGLITPIIFEADSKGVIEISKEMKVLGAKAREGKLQPHEFQGGTFSVSNLGMFGVTHFTSIINPPQSCILAVGASQKKLIPDDKNEKGFRTVEVLNVTISSDHRVVDGAMAAEWLATFREFLEDPETMIL